MSEETQTSASAVADVMTDAEAGSVGGGHAKPIDFKAAMEAVAAFELTVLDHPRHAAALRALAALQARALVASGRRRLKARGLLLTGSAGAGKSTVVELWAELNPWTTHDDGEKRPVLVVEVPEHPTRRSLVVRIFGAMGYKPDRDVTAIDIIDEIETKARLLGVELIILDEAHHVLAGKDVEAISEFLKSLLNQIGAGIVFAGLPDLEELRNAEQFDRRLAPDVRLTPYDFTDVPERLEFLGLLEAMAVALPLPEKPDLANQAVARRLYAATRGEIGLVSKYVSEALLLALTRGVPTIDLPLLAEVDAAWHPVRPPSNQIGFDDDIDEDANLGAMLDAARHVVLDPDANPFCCPREHVLTILGRRRAAPELYVASRKRTGRRARGTGPDEPKAF